MKKDNAGKLVKIGFRQRVLSKIANPKILETHGGKGAIGKALYLQYQGVVFEKNPEKTKYLLEQRPHWAIYEGDCIPALTAGIGFHITPNFIDCDPYGSPWPILKAIFSHGDQLADTVGIAVNDGLRRKVQLGGSWSCEILKPYVLSHGNAWINKNWEIVVRDLFEKTVVGFEVCEWLIMSSGHGGAMTQYGAIIKKAANGGLEKAN